MRVVKQIHIKSEGFLFITDNHKLFLSWCNHIFLNEYKYTIKVDKYKEPVLYYQALDIKSLKGICDLAKPSIEIKEENYYKYLGYII